MKQLFKSVLCLAVVATMVSFSGKGTKAKTAEGAETTTQSAAPEYTVVDNACVDLASFPVDKGSELIQRTQNWM